MALIMVEKDILKNLDFPQVSRIFDIIEDDNQFIVVMEKVLEGHLDDALTKLDGLTQKSIFYIMKQLFSALNYLHKKGIAHRDLKSENIMISLIEPYSAGSEDMKLQIKLIDFGLAQHVGNASSNM